MRFKLQKIVYLHYEEFQEEFDNNAETPNLAVIKRMFGLSQRLTKKRFDEGSIDFV